jgi:hypothetical protein
MNGDIRNKTMDKKLFAVLLSGFMFPIAGSAPIELRVALHVQLTSEQGLQHTEGAVNSLTYCGIEVRS